MKEFVASLLRHTRGVLSVAVGSMTVVLGGCAPPSGSDSPIDQSANVSGEWEEGSLGVYIATDERGRDDRHYTLRTSRGDERPLLFDTPVELMPGARVHVDGVSTAEGLRVRSFRALAPALSGVDSTASALVSAPAYRPRSFAFVLVDIGGGVNVTKDSVLSSLIGAPESLRNYYLADSFGRQDITAEVIGPLSYPVTTCSMTDMLGLVQKLRPMVSSTTTFDHYLWYLGTRLQSCGWLGQASVGTPNSPTRDTWYNASTNCVVLVQEPGHNFGMQHSSSLACPGAAFADDPNACTADEYGDVFDPMGGAASCRHMNAWQKAYQGWFGGCNGVSVTLSGTFTLLPIETRCDGAQFLKVKAPKARSFNRAAAGGGPATVETLSNYYVELRTPVDFDGTLGARTALQPQILIHAGSDVATRNQMGVHTYLLDMTPTTTSRSDAALKVGTTFTDPAGGVSITAVAISATQATIKVDVTGGVGDATCLDGTVFAAPGPGHESCSTEPLSGGGTSGTGGASGTGGDEAGGSGGAIATGGAGPADGASGGGGCACAIGEPNRTDSGLALFAMGALFVSRRRRSRSRKRGRGRVRDTAIWPPRV